MIICSKKPIYSLFYFLIQWDTITDLEAKEAEKLEKGHRKKLELTMMQALLDEIGFN